MIIFSRTIPGISSSRRVSITHHRYTASLISCFPSSISRRLCLRVADKKWRKKKTRKKRNSKLPLTAEWKHRYPTRWYNGRDPCSSSRYSHKHCRNAVPKQKQKMIKNKDRNWRLWKARRQTRRISRYVSFKFWSRSMRSYTNKRCHKSEERGTKARRLCRRKNNKQGCR